MDDNEFSVWVGRTTTQSDVVTAAPLRALNALLDRCDDGAAQLPPLGHWLYFLPCARQSELNADGHPRLGADLPDLGLPRRMWAGSRISFICAPSIGDEIERRTQIQSVLRKQGASGSLGFVTLRHEIHSGGQLAIVEEQDLVYRAAAKPGSSANPAPSEAPPIPAGAITRAISADPILLFRFSAVTFNAHRIHYDAAYARDVEGYSGLVVHGPLQAMLLMDFFRAAFPGRDIKSFSFRAQAPFISGTPATLGLEEENGSVKAWVRPETGPYSMTAEFRFSAALNNPSGHT